MNSPLQQYQSVRANQAVSGADPHRLIVMLMEGSIEKIAAARGFLSEGKRAEKAQQISWAISIIDGLRMSLDKEQGGEIADNLDNLYGYMEETLMQANLNDDLKKLEEVSSLMKTILSGWMEIAPETSQVEEQHVAADNHFRIGV
jgi:flagellar protein FliS